MRQIKPASLRHGLAVSVAAFLAMGLFIVASASPAAAHTALLETIPDNRASLGESPEEVTLVFAEAVDPRSVNLEILGLEDGSIPGVVRLTPASPDSKVIVFSIPPLPDGVFGMPWQTVGPDGHRVAGEVVIGVGVIDSGDLAGATFLTTPSLDRALALGSTIGRYVFYVGLSLFAGSLWLVWWRRSRQGSQPTSSALESIDDTATSLLSWSPLVILLGVASRMVTSLWSLARGFGTGSPGADLRQALVSRSGLAALSAAVLAGVLVIWVPRASFTGRPRNLGVGAALGSGIAGLAVANGHTALLAESVLGIWVATVHIVGAAVWIGPVTVFALATLRKPWRLADPGERRQVSRSVFGDFSGWAMIAFGLVLLSGVQSVIVTVGADFFNGRYGSVLLVKLLVVAAVLVPLGMYHDAIAGWWSARAPKLSNGHGFASTLRLEVVGMSIVLLFAAVLTSANPTVISPPSGASPEAAPPRPAAAGLLSAGPVDDVSSCVALTVGKANCYRDYFAGLMENEGADVAVAEIYALSQSDDYVSSDCHQVAHDLGNDAAIHYADLGVALGFEGSACWSGYYHGVVEYMLAAYDDDQLLGELPSVCTEAAANVYSFTHYNCVHGVGHGVMLRLEADLFGSISYCEQLADPWEVSVCVGAVFMENIVSAQQGTVVPALDTEDLIYPCNAVADDYVDECFSMQTSWMLWQLDYDFQAAFDVCDDVASDMLDDCYRSMGRDASGNSRLDVALVVELCGLGADQFEVECYIGAAMNAVYNDHDVAKATALCAAIPDIMQAPCRAARDQAASTL
jgi:putative copper export protein/methionine-rich copper-binding protein CopC